MTFWQTLLVSSLSGIITGGIVTYFVNKKLENESLQRVQATKIAGFFAKWAKYSGNENIILDKKNLHDYYEELTKMSYELSLWVKDEKLVKQIMERLTNAEDALTTKKLIIKIRELVLGKKSKILKADHLVHWWVKDNKNNS